MTTNPAAQPAPLLVRERHLPNLVGMSRAQVRRLMAKGRFPIPIRLGRHCVAWRRSDIERWVADGCPFLPGDRK
jgi:predicted DNA-binding transcriptional regulator AlpA